MFNRYIFIRIRIRLNVYLRYPYRRDTYYTYMHISFKRIAAIRILSRALLKGTLGTGVQCTGENFSFKDTFYVTLNLAALVYT